MAHGYFKRCLLLWLSALPCLADDLTVKNPVNSGSSMIEHHDSTEIDPALTLSQLVEQTLEKYPDRLINEALEQQADALQQRGDSWLAGSTALALDYFDDRVADNRGSREASAKLEFTVWNWGQRSAAQNVAEQAHHSAQKQSAAVKLEVYRLVRAALWDMSLAENRLQQAQYNLDISGRLLEKVRRRVELGDLPRADLLLAESEHLQNRSLLTQAEAEMMHSRKSYASLTQTTKVPGTYLEQQSAVDTILPDHPVLEAINAMVARKQAATEWAKTTDTINQPKINLGAKSSRDQRGGDDMQSVGIGVVIPFGHSTYDAPEIASAHLELNQALAQREHLQRQLEKNLHEALHAVEVTHQEVTIANQMKDIAAKHLAMTEVSFNAGEINLLDLLKIQARSLEAIRNAKEQEIRLQRNIAMYNQAVGVQP
ncbi:TolC family protein [Methylomonas sp. LL1]|uniref:TolC family protein n=1 Tax=Methylomonas sp. LL1 TaxID=2785785 RepID=UPI0018C3AE24|nr:TolC family protein [Methylomonas sp. LL1]QPK61651.1 TolC family protein [Methylomonas sp. LL1]